MKIAYTQTSSDKWIQLSILGKDFIPPIKPKHYKHREKS